MQNAEATGTSTASSSVSELILAAALLESFVSAVSVASAMASLTVSKSLLQNRSSASRRSSSG